MLICGQPRKMKTVTPTMNPHVAMMMSLTAPTGVSLNRDMMNPPLKLPSAPANDHDRAVPIDELIIYYLLGITAEELHNKLSRSRSETSLCTDTITNI